MWCRNCHQFWDFTTGYSLDIVSRNQIHNPDFFAWERSTITSIPRREERMSDQIPLRVGEAKLDIWEKNLVFLTTYDDVTYMYYNIYAVESKIRFLRRDRGNSFREIRSKR